MKIINPIYHDLSIFRETFCKAKPFPYIVLDDFLDQNFFKSIHNIAENFQTASNGVEFNSSVENKWISLNTSLPAVIKEIVSTLNSKEWVENMIRLSTIKSLLVVSNEAELANYHVMGKGSFLGSHVDHSHESVNKNPHVLNIIFYLSEEWDPDDGGGTQFYNYNGKEVITEVSYKPNRAVIFLHTPYSFHGVGKISNHIQTPRRSVYVDYYSENQQPYSSFNIEPNNKWFKHGTTFVQQNFYSYLKISNFKYMKTMTRYKLNKFLSKLRSI